MKRFGGISPVEEKSELECVLASERFSRSPQLGKLLEYVCSRYFQGQADDLKEYNIATEVLGRSMDFDPAQDAIVRVEAHRLRKKLQEYYAEEGSEHAIKIVLARGKYTPVFQHVRRPADSSSDHLAPLAIHPAAVAVVENLPESSIFTSSPGEEHSTGTVVGASAPIPTANNSRDPRHKWQLIVGLSFGFVLLAGVIWALQNYQALGFGGKTVFATNGRTLPPDPAGSVIRILAGSQSSPHTDPEGRIWDRDRYYSGGQAVTYPATFIARTNDPSPFRAARTGDFSYDIPLKPGTYELHLLFAEQSYGPAGPQEGGESSRTFMVKLNGQVLLDDFDVFADAGGESIADERIFRDVHPAADGRLHLQFFREMGDPIVNGIEIIPGIARAQLPIRLVMQPKSLTDHLQHAWSPDDFFAGGRTFGHRETVSGADDADIYDAERFGRFSYAIPVDTRDKYAVTLRFTEAYWGSAYDRTRSGAGSRIFNVDCNGVRLVSNLDIYKEAGGLRPLVKTFRNLRPNAHGKLELSFDPVVNYATISALEVEDQGP